MYGLRALKQKIFVDGLCYLLQEIYGIENKNINKVRKFYKNLPFFENQKLKSFLFHKCIQVNIDDDSEDNGSECVICMSDTRDTLILPCRHLCLCNSCADSLRYQANNCPICRSPFRALLQIRAVHKSSTATNTLTTSQSLQEAVSGDNIPIGYVPVSLIEALNGPTAQTTALKTQLDEINDSDSIKQAAEILNRSDSNNGENKLIREKKDKNIPPEVSFHDFLLLFLV